MRPLSRFPRALWRCLLASRDSSKIVIVFLFSTHITAKSVIDEAGA
jgi:hypothetical protein